DDSPPYPHLYHLGLARLALATRDMDADLATLQSMGVELVGPPARVLVDGVQVGGRFVCFKDPDGTVSVDSFNLGSGTMAGPGAV
ncbi:MAG: hypothetical protein HC871_08535, partial [Rhizobiales bacterium]|nr:hypothetical protein [Hyphomicrobiales bacterium]